MATMQLGTMKNTESNPYEISRLQKLLFFRPAGLKSLMRGRHWENLNKKRKKFMEKLACGKNVCISRLQIEALEPRIVPAAYDLTSGAYVEFAAGGDTGIIAFNSTDTDAVLHINYEDNDVSGDLSDGDEINFFSLGEKTGQDVDNGSVYNIFTNFGSEQTDLFDSTTGGLEFYDTDWDGEAINDLDADESATVNITTGVNFSNAGGTVISNGASNFSAATGAGVDDVEVAITSGSAAPALGSSIDLIDFSDVDLGAGKVNDNDINVTIGQIEALLVTGQPSGDIDRIDVDLGEAIAGTIHAEGLVGTLEINLTTAYSDILLGNFEETYTVDYQVTAGSADFTLDNMHYTPGATGANALTVDSVTVDITSTANVAFNVSTDAEADIASIDLMGTSAVSSNYNLAVDIEHGDLGSLTLNDGVGNTGANLTGLAVDDGNAGNISVDGRITGAVTVSGSLGNVTVLNQADNADGVTAPISAVGIGAIDVNGNVTAAADINANAGNITSVNVHSDIAGDILGVNIGPVVTDGNISGNIIATGSISTVNAGAAITSVNITAATNITSITAGTGITGGAIQATAGSIGTVTATTGNISDTINAGTTIGTVTTLSATGDIAAAVTANGTITLVSAGRDITAAGDITSNTGNVTTVTAVRDIAGDVKATAGSIGTVTATTGAITNSITAPTGIGSVTAQTGINSTINSAGTDGADVNLDPDAGTGTIGSVTANTGNIAGTINAGTTVGTVTATTGAISANVTAKTSITTVSAATGISGAINATGYDGEDVDVLVDAGTGTIGMVTSAAGNISGLITANGAIGTVDATAGSVTNNVISATGNITAVTAGTSVTGNVTATLGSVGNVEAKTTATNTLGNVAGAVTAGTTIGTVSADGNITGDLTANSGIGAITAGGYVGNGGGTDTDIWANADNDLVGTGIASISAGGYIWVDSISTQEPTDATHSDNDQNNIGAISAGGAIIINDLLIGGSATTISGGINGDVQIANGVIDGDIDSVTSIGTGQLNVHLMVYNLTTGSPMFVATDALNDDVYTIDSSAGTTATMDFDINGGNATVLLTNLAGTTNTTALAIKTTQLSDGLDSDAAFNVLGIDYNNDGGITAAPVAGIDLLSIDIEGNLANYIDLGTGDIGSIYLEGVTGTPSIQAASLQAIGIQDEAPADIEDLINLDNVVAFVPVDVTNIQLEATATGVPGTYNTTGYFFSTTGVSLDGAIYLTAAHNANATADIDYIDASADYIVGNVVLPALGFETNVSVLSISEAGSQAGALVGFIEVEGDLGGITFTDNNVADAERANLGIVNVGYNLGAIGAAEAAPVNVKAGAVMAVASLGAVSVAGQLQGRIKVTGDIDGVTADSSNANGDIAASGNITANIVAIAGDLDGDITAGAELLTDLGDDNAIGGVGLNADTTISVGSILANVSASQNIDGNILAADNITGNITATVEDINGSITAGDNITGNITAGDDIDGNILATLGSITGNILATGTNDWGGIRGDITAGVNIIGNITATNNDIDGDITAGNNITGNITAGEDIDGNIDAGNDITGEIAAGDEIEGNITAGVDINAGYDIIAGTEISGNIIAELGNLAIDNIIAGTNITGNTISAGLDISTSNILAGFTAPGVLSGLGGSINNVDILSGRVGFGDIDSDIIAADDIDPTLIDAGNGDGGSVLGDIVAGADGTGSIIELTITADQNVGSLGGGQIVAAADEITDIDVTAGVAPQAQGDGVLYSDFHADGDTTIFPYSEDPGFPVGYPDGGSITGSFVAIQDIESDFLAAHNIGDEADGVWINSVYGDINGTIWAGIGTGFVQGNYSQNYGGDIYGNIIAGHDINADIIAETGLCIWAGDIEANIFAGMNLLTEGADFINLNDDFSCPIYDTFIGVPVDGFPITSDVQNLNDTDVANGLLILGSLDTDAGDHSDVFLYHANANGMLEIDAAYSPIYDILGGDAYTPTIEIFDPETYQPLNTTQVVAGNDYYIAIESYNFPDVDDEGGDYAVKITFVPFAGGTNYGSITSQASIVADNDVQYGIIFAVDDIVPSEITAGDDIQWVFFLTNKGTIGADGAPLDISAGNDISNVYMMAFEDSVYLDMSAGGDIDTLGVFAGGGIFGSMTADPIINVDLVADGDVGTVDDHFVINGEWGVEDVYVEGANVYLDVLAQGLDNTDPLNPVTADIIDLEIFTEGAFGTSGSPSLVIASGSLDGAIFNIGEWQADVTVGDSILDMAIISAGDIGSTVNPLQIYAPNDIMNTGFYGNNIYVNVEAGDIVDALTFDGEGIVGLADGDLAVTGEWGVSNVYMYGNGIFMDVFAPGTYTDPCDGGVGVADIYNVEMVVNTDITPCGMYYYVGDIGTDARARMIQATGDVDDVTLTAQNIYVDIDAGYDITDVTASGSDNIMTVDVEGNVVMALTAGNDIATVDIAGEGDVDAVLAAGNTVDTVDIAAGGMLTGSILGYMGVDDVTLTGFGGVDVDVSATGVDALGNGADVNDLTITTVDGDPLTADGDVDTTVTASNDIIDASITGVDVNAILDAGNQIKGTNTVTASGVLTGDVAGFMGIANLTLTGLGGVDLDVTAAGVDALGNGSDILDLVITSVDGNPLTIDGDIGAALNAVAIFASRDIIDFAVSGRNVYTSVTAQNQIKKLNLAANIITASGVLGGEGLGLGVTGTMGVSDLSMTGLGGVFTFVSATGVDALGNGSDITNLWISASDGSALTPNGDIGSEVDSVDVTASGNIVDSGLVTEGDMFLNMTAGGGVQGLDLTAWGMMGDAAGGNLLTGMFGVDIDTLSVGGDLNMDVIAGAQMNGTPFAGNINDANLPSINSMLYAPAALNVDQLSVEGDFNSTFVAASDLTIGYGTIEGSLLGNDGMGGRALLAAVANNGDMTLDLTIYGIMAAGINVGNFVPFDLSGNVSIGGVNAGPFQAGTVITLGNLYGSLQVSAINGANDGVVGGNGITLDEVLAGTESLADANFLGTTTFSATGDIDMDILVTGYPTLGFEGVNYATGDVANLSMMAFGDVAGSLTAMDSININFIMANVDAVTAIGTYDDTDPSTPSTLLPNNNGLGDMSMEIVSRGMGQGGITGGVITAGFDPFVLINAGTSRPANAPVDPVPPSQTPKVPDFFDAWGLGSINTGHIRAEDGDPTDGWGAGDIRLAYVAAGQDFIGAIYADDDIAFMADSSEILPGIDLDIVAGLSANSTFAPFGTTNDGSEGAPYLMTGGCIKVEICAGDDIYKTDAMGEKGMISIIAQGGINSNIVSGVRDQFDDFFLGFNEAPDGDVHGNIDAIIIASKGVKGYISAGNASGIYESSSAGSAGGSFTGTVIGGAGIDLLIDNSDAAAAVNVDNFIDKGDVLYIYADNDITFESITVGNVVLDGLVSTGTIGHVIAGYAGIGSGAITGNITAAGDIDAIIATTQVGNVGDLIAAGGEIGGVIAGDPSNLADLALDFDVNPSDKVFLDSVGTINADVYAGGTLGVIGAGLDINGSVFAGEFSGHVGTFTYVENGKIAVINSTGDEDLNLIEITDGNINTLDMVHTGNGGFNTIGSDMMFGFDELVIADSVEGNIFVATGGIGSLTVSDWAIDRLGSNESARDAFRISQATIAGVPAVIANEQLAAYQSPVSKQFNELLEGATGITGSVSTLTDIGDAFIWGSLTGSLISYTGDIGEVTVGEIDDGGIMASAGSIGNIYVLDDIVGATITAKDSIGNVMVQDSIVGDCEITEISVTDGDLGTITVGIDPFAYGDGDKVGIDYTDIWAKGDIGKISVLHGDLTESDIYNVESFDGDLGGINVKGVIDDVLIDIDGDIVSHTAYFDGAAFSGAIMAGGEIDYVSITASSIGADATAIISGTEGTGALTDSEILADGVDGEIGTILVRGTIGSDGWCDDGTSIKAEHGTVGNIIVDKIDDLNVTAAESIGNIIALQDARKGIQDLRLTVLNVGGEIGNIVSHGDIEELTISDFDGEMGDIVSLNGWVWIENDCNEWTLEGGIGDIYASEGIWLDGISIEHGNLADDGSDAVTQMSVDALGRSYYSGAPVDGIYCQNGEIEIEDIYVNGNVGDIQTDLGYVFIEDTYVSGNIGDITSENYVIFGDISDVYYGEIDFWDQGAVIVSGNVGDITSTMGGLFVYADVGGNVGDIDVDKGLDGLLVADGAIGDITVGQSIGGNDYFDYSDDDGYQPLTTQNGNSSSSTRIESNEGIGEIAAGYNISAEIVSLGDIDDVYAGIDIYDSFIWAKEDIGVLAYGTGVRADGNIYAGNYIYAGDSIGVIEAMNLGILDECSSSSSTGYTCLVPDTDGIADDNDVVIYNPDNDDILDFVNDYMVFKDVNNDGHIDIAQDVLDYMDSETGDSTVLDDGIIDSDEALAIANWWAANHVPAEGDVPVENVSADYGEIVVIDVDDVRVVDMCDEVEYSPSAPAPLVIIAEGLDVTGARAIGAITTTQDIFTDIAIDTTRGGIGTITAGGDIGEVGYAGELAIEVATSIETIKAGTGIDNLAIVAEAQGTVNVGQMSDGIDNDGDNVTDEIDEIFWSATPQGVGIVGGIVSNTGDISLSIETPGQIGPTVAATGSIDAQYNAVGQVGVFVAQQDITLDVLATNGLAKSSDGISIWSMTGGTVSGTLITRDYGSIIGDNELDIDYTSSAQNDVVITYLDTDTATTGINSSMSFVNADGNMQTISVAGSGIYVDVKVMTLYGRVLGIEVSGSGSLELVSSDNDLSNSTAHIGTLVVVDDQVNIVDVTRLNVDGDLQAVESRGANNSVENVVAAGNIGSIVSGNDIVGIEAGGSIGELRALYGSISSVVSGDSIDSLWANEDIADVQAGNTIDSVNAQNDVYGVKADTVNIVQAGNNASSIQATTQINLVTAVKNVSNVVGGTINVISAGATAQNISGIDGNGDEINVYAGVKVVNIANNLETSVA